MTPQWLLAGTTIVLLFTQPFTGLVRADSHAAIENLGSLGHDTFARAVNAAGDTVGHGLLSDFSSRGFITTGGALQVMPTLGGSESAAHAVNNARIVAGFARDADSMPRAVRYNPGDESLDDLGTLGGDYSFAYGINAAGTIVGYAETSDGNLEAFEWSPGGGMTSLGTLGGEFSFAYGINNFGQIVGEAENAAGRMRAFVYSAGVMQDLGTLGGPDSGAFAINDAGMVTGASSINGGSHAFRYVPGSGMQDLGTLGGSFSSGEAIAPDGTVVGWAMIGTGGSRACLWTLAGEIVDLHTLIDPALGWNLLTATGINGSGQVVGYGVLGGVLRPFRLTLPWATEPEDEPGNGGTPPVIHSITATPAALWPPNGQMVAVQVSVHATYGDGSAAACWITGVTSSHGEVGADVVSTGPLSLQLRARRPGNSDRVYQIDVACGAGNALATGHVQVVVPHKQPQPAPGRGR